MRDEDLNYLNQFLVEFQGETDRGAALVGAALLDDRLLRLLKSHFLNKKQSRELLEGGTAPLGTFSSRIKASYCLGLLTDLEYKELQLIRKVRNKFAHEGHGLTFDEPELEALCGSFLARFSKNTDEAETVNTTPRVQFINAVIFTSLALWYRPEHAKKVKAEQQEEWPY